MSVSDSNFATHNFTVKVGGCQGARRVLVSRAEDVTMRFKDRVALITAAASGIGKATAEIIGAEGGIVVAVDTDSGRLEKVVAALRDAGGRAHGLRADALDRTQVRGVVAARVGDHGRSA